MANLSVTDRLLLPLRSASFGEMVALFLSASNAVKLLNLGNLKHIVHQPQFLMET